MNDIRGAVLWDVDGTMIDSLELHWLSWQDVLAQENFVLSYPRFLETFGQRNDTILKSYFGPDISPEAIDRITDGKEECYRGLIVSHGIQLLPGVEEWLGRLEKMGWKQAIASSAPRKNVEVIIEYFGLEKTFQAVVTAQDVTVGKPDPQVFLTAASRLGIAPERCIVVEDAPAGVEGARRAGMRCIGVTNTHAQLEADRVVDRLDSLQLDVFEQLLREAKAGNKEYQPGH